MDADKYMKKILYHDIDIEPDRYAANGDKSFGGETEVSGVFLGATFCSPFGAVTSTIVSTASFNEMKKKIESDERGNKNIENEANTDK